MIAEIIINTTAKQLQQTFSYIAPPALDVRVGSRVVVPFGGRTEDGIVVALNNGDPSDYPFPLKEIQAVLSARSGFQEEMVLTARWISRYYLCNMADALRLFMIEKKGIESYISVMPGKAVPLTDDEDAVVAYVRSRGSVAKKKLEEKFGPAVVAALLEKQGLAAARDWKNNLAVKTEKWLSFVKDDDEGILRSRRRQKELLQELKALGSAPARFFLKKGYSPDVIRRLCATGMARATEQTAPTRQLLPSLRGDRPFTLTAEQERAVQAVRQGRDGATYVLRGVTGSGKTEVYMQLAEDVWAQGKQVIVLEPEIALTGQIVRRFIRRFGDDVVVMHSQLSKGERKNNWLRMLFGESHICIGARSAVFTAAKDIGLIIVDECHDSSYKQEESPRYHAVEVARRRASYYGCPVVLGSATPSVSQYYLAKEGAYTLLELTERVMHRQLPDVAVVDMRDELARGNYGVLSDAMAALLASTLAARQQAIILLNRRGFSTFVMCRKCGYVVKCDTCDVPMVYHKQNDRLRCHYCDAEKSAPAVCPACGSKYIKFFGTGTEKVEEQLRETFPQARIVRLDQDTASRKNSGDHILERFRRHEYDILLGTQMVAKGHDFENVAAVGILAADSLLNLPAYWAGERTFQLLTQAAGRAGRGDVPGHVVMQTYAPDHYVIQCAQKQDYRAFYEQEIAFRQAFSYPPFHRLVKIIIVHESEEALWKKGNDLAALLKSRVPALGEEAEIIGPFVDIVKKIRNKYRVVILIKGPSLEKIKDYMRGEKPFWERGVIIDVDPSF